MDYMETVKSRYSCKKYCDKQISKEQLDAILEAEAIEEKVFEIGDDMWEY